MIYLKLIVAKILHPRTQVRIKRLRNQDVIMYRPR